MESIVPILPVAFGNILGYLLVGLTTVTAEHLIPWTVFPSRISSALWSAYFFMKHAGDALFCKSAYLANSYDKTIKAKLYGAEVNLACEAVERTDDEANETVEPRIRGVGDQVLFRLDVPDAGAPSRPKESLRSLI